MPLTRRAVRISSVRNSSFAAPRPPSSLENKRRRTWPEADVSRPGAGGKQTLPKTAKRSCAARKPRSPRTALGKSPPLRQMATPGSQDSEIPPCKAPLAKPVYDRDRTPRPPISFPSPVSCFPAFRQMWKICQEGHPKSKVMTTDLARLTPQCPQRYLAGLFSPCDILNL